MHHHWPCLHIVQCTIHILLRSPSIQSVYYNNGEIIASISISKASWGEIFIRKSLLVCACHLPKGLERCFELNAQQFRLEKCHLLKLSWYSKYSFKSSDKNESLVQQVQNLSVISDIVFIGWSMVRSSNSNGGAAILSADGAKVPGVSLKVRYCSPRCCWLQVSCRCCIGLPPTPFV